jgi:hypothetical protein
MLDWIRVTRKLLCVCVLYAGAVAAAAAASAPSPKVIACLNACEQVQIACMRGPLQMPPEQRTIKELNIIRACNETDVRCDHKCRSKR